jgi:hypothetical protein
MLEEQTSLDGAARGGPRATWSHLGLVGCLIDDSQIEEINCCTFQYRKGCQTHEELKVLVSKFNRKNNIKAVVFGFLV